MGRGGGEGCGPGRRTLCQSRPARDPRNRFPPPRRHLTAPRKFCPPPYSPSSALTKQDDTLLPRVRLCLLRCQRSVGACMRGGRRRRRHLGLPAGPPQEQNRHEDADHHGGGHRDERQAQDGGFHASEPAHNGLQPPSQQSLQTWQRRRFRRRWADCSASDRGEPSALLEHSLARCSFQATCQRLAGSLQRGARVCECASSRARAAPTCKDLSRPGAHGNGRHRRGFQAPWVLKRERSMRSI